MRTLGWIVTAIFLAWMNGMVSGAEPLKPDVSRAAVSGVAVVPLSDQVWQLQGTQVNRRGSAGTMTNSWGYATFPSATEDLEIKGTLNILRPGKLYSFQYGSYFPMQ